MYKTHKITDRILQIEEPMDVCVTLILGDNKALLLDTEFGLMDLKSYVESITDLPLIVVNSHGHIDHANGNFRFDEVYLNFADMDVIADHTSLEMKKQLVKGGLEAGVITNDFNEDVYINSGYGKVVPLEEGKIFDLGGITLEVIYSPGHSPGSISLLCREERILLTGDSANERLFLFGKPNTTLEDSLDGYINTLNKLKALDFDYLLSSHAISITPKSRLDNYMHCAQTMTLGKCKKVVLQLSHEVTTMMYTDTEPMENGKYPAICYFQNSTLD